MEPLVLTICVNYHMDCETYKFVMELLSQEISFRQSVIIVDNGERDNAHENGVSLLEELTRDNTNMIYYHANENLGYYGAANWGLREYLRTATLPEWIIVCNTDISFNNRTFLASLVEMYNHCPPAIVAPAIISKARGIDTNPFKKARPTRMRMHSYKLIYRYKLLLIAYLHIASAKQRLMKMSMLVRSANPHPQESYNIYAPHGAFVIFNKKYFEAGGTLEYDSFLFHEETFIAETARELGLDILYEPTLEVIHDEHASTSDLASIRKYKYEASVYCANRYFPWTVSKHSG